MSRHFELMQQLEKEQRVGPLPVSDPRPSSRAASRYSDPQSWANDEALRLVQQIFLVPSPEPPRVVVFAGIDHGNGCSQICAAVAGALAKNALRPVCLVEANFRSPSLSALLGTSNRHGFAESLQYRERPVNSFAEPVEQENLWLLSSGPLAGDSPSLLSSDSVRDRIQELRGEFDFVIVDAPPLTRYSDAIALAQSSDGLVLVLEAESTRREAAAVVTANLRSANIPILAAVLNKRTFPIPEKIYSRI